MTSDFPSLPSRPDHNDPDRPRSDQPSLLDEQEPVPFSLTARARRVVAPDSLPALSVVTPVQITPAQADDVEGELDEEADRVDPRRARARALRRAGSRPESIVAELHVDLETVARWTDDVAPAKAAVRRSVAGEHRQRRDLPAAYVTARAAAKVSWRRGAPAIGAAMVAGMAQVTPFSVRLQGTVSTVAGVLQWLRDTQVVPDSSVRVQVLAAPGRSMDLVAHEVADRLALDAERVQARPWDQAPDAEAIDVLVRISEPRLAGTIDGWRACLLEELTGSTNASLDPDEVAAVG